MFIAVSIYLFIFCYSAYYMCIYSGLKLYIFTLNIPGPGSSPAPAGHLVPQGLEQIQAGGVFSLKMAENVQKWAF